MVRYGDLGDSDCLSQKLVNFIAAIFKELHGAEREDEACGIASDRAMTRVVARNTRDSGFTACL
jgi:hypothetical protein